MNVHIIWKMTKYSSHGNFKKTLPTMVMDGVGEKFSIVASWVCAINTLSYIILLPYWCSNDVIYGRTISSYLLNLVAFKLSSLKAIDHQHYKFLKMWLSSHISMDQTRCITYVMIRGGWQKLSMWKYMLYWQQIYIIKHFPKYAMILCRVNLLLVTIEESDYICILNKLCHDT